jgi:hypothetical protein
MLGEWQDNEVLLKEVNYFRKEFLPPIFEETKDLKKFASTIRNLKSEILEAVSNGLSVYK